MCWLLRRLHCTATPSFEGAGAIAESLFIEIAKRRTNLHAARRRDGIVSTAIRFTVPLSPLITSASLSPFSAEVTHDSAVFSFHAAAQTIVAAQAAWKRV